MAFPVTVSTVTQSAEGPGKYGPYLVGTNRYEILLTLVLDSGSGFYQPYLSAYKSTDLGATWNEVAAGSRPAAGNEVATIYQVTPYTCCQSQTDPTKIFTIYVNPSSGQIGIIAFDATGDTWGSPLSSSGVNLLLTPPIQSSSGFIGGNGFIVAIHRSASNDVLLAFPQSNYTDASDEIHWYPQVVSYDVAGNAWGTPFDVSYNDYATVIGWTQVPCGFVLDSGGVAHLFTQQVTHTVPAAVQSISVGQTVPWYGGTADVDVWGGGGGGAGASDLWAGGGGGAGAYANGSVALTPLSTITGTIGTGGPGGTYDSALGGAGSDGTGTSVLTVSAGGGAGAPIAGVPGGNGGSGFVVTSDGGGGGGGGGTDNAYGSGGVGGDGIIYDGTPDDPNGGDGGTYGAGAAGGSGGAGGTYNPVDFPSGGGGGGAQPGGGGGGGARAGNGGDGGPGDCSITYTAVQGTVYNSRLWQQAINADNTLGTLSEISDGEFPIQSFECVLTLMPFDCAAGPSGVSIAFSGAYNTTGYSDIEVMSGANADPISFSGTSFSTGGSVEPSPAVAIDSGGKTYCAYKQATSGAACTFLYRDSGSSFGTSSSFGSFADSFCRLQVGAFGPIPEITFGVPTIAAAEFSPTS